MEKNQVLKGLESFVPSEYLEILKDNSSLEEKLMAIYTKALKPDLFRFYKPEKMPPLPKDWMEEQEFYQSLKPNEKPPVWREMLVKFGGYIKALESAKSQNISNKVFLNDMLKFFQDKNMPIQTAQITQRLIEFEALGVA